MWKELQHLLYAALHAKGKDARWIGVALIVVGLFLTPMLIGIPLVIWGFVKLFSKD